MPVVGIALVPLLVGALESLAISFIASYVIGALTQALGGDSQQKATGQENQLTTVKEPLARWKAIYGRARVGGAWVYIHTTGNPTIGTNSALMGAIVLACHECDAIEKIYFGNDEIPVNDADGSVTGPYAGWVHIWKHRGNVDQLADYWLQRWGDGTWTADHRLRGRCYIAIDLAYNKDLFPAMPQISARVRGHRITDPRDGRLKWTDNPVMAIRNYLIGTGGYQMAIPATDIDDANFASEANVCDETVQVALGSGGFKIPTVGFTAAVSTTYSTGGTREHAGFIVRTTTSAFTLANDDLGLHTGQRIQMTGTIPHPLLANHDYWIIRKNATTVIGTNAANKPTYQLASSAANANAGIALAITTGGSGTWWKMRDLWLTDNGLAGILGQGDAVLLYTNGTLPPPLQQGVLYYWLPVSPDTIAISTPNPFQVTPQIQRFGEGCVCYSVADAWAGNRVALTGIGSGSHGVTRWGQTRYSCNGVVNTSAKPSDILGMMLSSCGGRLVNSGGKWRIYTAAWRPPLDELTEPDLRGPIKVQTLVSRRDLFNRVVGTYTSPQNFDQPQDFPPYPDPTRPDLDLYLAEDGGFRIESNPLPLPFTNSPAMAQRLAKIYLLQMRRQISITWPGKLSIYGIGVPDVVLVTMPRYGWSQKAFEVVDWTFRLDAGGADAAPVPGIDLNLRQTGPANYDWNNGMETVSHWAGRTQLPSTAVVPTPVLLHVLEDLYVTQSSAGAKTRLHVQWQVVGDGFAGWYRIQYRVWGAVNWLVTERFPASAGNSAYIYDLTPGYSYELQIKAVNMFEVSSPWSPSWIQYVRGLSDPPASIANFRAAAFNGHAHLTWTRAPDLDVINGGYIWLRWSPLTSGATWGTAPGLDLKLAGNATEATVMLKTGTYLAQAVDSTGNRSLLAATAVLIVPAAAGYSVVLTSNEDPTFAGTHHNTAVGVGLVRSVPVLHLAYTSTPLEVDAWPFIDDRLTIDDGTGSPTGDMDTWPDVDSLPLWDGAGGVVPNGEYYFAATIDLGAVFGFRLEPVLYSATSPPDAEADARAFVEVRFTNDDPASPTAVWTDWQAYDAGDYVARGIQRRCQLRTANPQIEVSQLGDIVSMATRADDYPDFVAAAGGSILTFDQPFYEPPFCTGMADVAGARVTFASVNTTQATVHVYNAAGSDAGGTCDIQVNGVGSNP